MVKIARNIKDNYLCFLYDIVRDSNHEDYRILLDRLHSIPFRVVVDRDSNRLQDGVDLRLYFCKKCGLELESINELDGECSVLEMMVALARRMENDILWDPDYGDRTPIWFWQMIDNLGLSSCTDENYDDETDDKVVHTIDILVSRHYFADGFGGLFPLKHATVDQRKVEIWYQMHAFLQEHDD
jgi:hypothetical protein